MKKWYTLWFTLVVAMVISTVGAAQAAEFSPQLEWELERAGAGDYISAIVILHSPIDIRLLDQRLHARKASKAERNREVVEALQYNAQQTQPLLRAEFDEAKLRGVVAGYTAYWIENLFVIHATREFIETLRPRGDIQYVTENFRAELITPIRDTVVPEDPPIATLNVPSGVRAVGAYRVANELGITGQGVLVANCDTGVDGNHPALASRWRGAAGAAPWYHCWRDALGTNTQFPNDLNSHGTHVMGTITGRAIVGADTQWVGCAPNAKWIATNSINQGGPWPSPAFNNDIIDDYQWFVNPDSNLNTVDDVPDVIQNSWGVFTGLSYPQCFDFWNTVILNCEAAGPVITWSAGNEGTQGLRSPAIYELNPLQIFSVGAVDATGFPNAPYPAASFSSRGPSPCQPNPGSIKPEICAPGVNVYSSVPGGGYASTNWSGTSMAGPHVAGVVALMREACPDCDHITIKEALLATAIDNGYPPAGEDNTFGAGFLNAYDAVVAVSSLGRVDGVISGAGGAPLHGVKIEVLTNGATVTSNASGYYIMVAPSGTHTLRYTKFGYDTLSVPNVTVVEGDTLHLNQTMNIVPSGVLVGTVMTQNGAPVQGARVKVQSTPTDTLISDANGRVTITLPANPYNVWVRITVNTSPPRTYTNTLQVTVPVADTLFADLVVMVSLVEPVGPDAYGYRAYDRYDRDYPAMHDWVEINPALNPENPGNAFDFLHHDSARFFYAPFSIGFYGVDADCLTVNPNGWMLPGWIHGAGNINTPIPSNTNNDPPGIIAPIWDDFRIGLGAQQFHRYDADEGRWIFQFVDQRIVTPQNRLFDWQVHFYDPAHHPTLTGDAEIMVVYRRADYLSGATIGIERQDETTGLQIRYNLTVDTTSWPIDSTAAIRYTTGRPAQTGTINGTLVLHPPSSDITSAVIWGGGDQTSPSANGQFTLYDAAAAQVSVALSLDGYEAWRLNRVRVGVDSTTTVTMAAWRLDPARDLWAYQYDGTVFLSWRQPLSTESAPNPNLRYNVYIDGLLAESNATDTTYSNTFAEGQEVVFSVEAVYRYGRAEMSVPFEITIDLAADDAGGVLPSTYALYQNYPNPFNPTTSIRLDIPERVYGALKLYDVSGRLVRTLHQGALSAGRYTFQWDSRDDRGLDVATGMYLCQFTSGNYVATQKMLLMK